MNERPVRIGHKMVEFLRCCVRSKANSEKLALSGRDMGIDELKNQHLTELDGNLMICCIVSKNL